LPLEKVAEVRSGVAKGKKSLKDPISVPYLRVANVQDGYLNLSEVKEIEIERNKLDRYSLRCGDVLMNEGGDFDKLGRGDVWDGQIEPCLHQNHVFAVRPNSDLLDSNFLQALAASYYGKTYFLSCSKRSTNLASINSTQLREFPVLLPPLPEQKKIAQILSTWDKAIATTEKLLANSQQQKKALMQQLLTGKKRLLDKNGVRFSGEWSAAPLGKTTRIYDGTHSTPKYVETGVPFYSVEHVTRNDFSNTKLISEKVFNSENKRVKVEKNDILMTRIGDIGTAKHLTWDVKASFYVSLALIKSSESFNSEFLSQYINSQEFQSELWKRTIHVAFPKKINLGEIGKCRIVLPALEEQRRIADVLSAIDLEISTIKASIAKLIEQKKALMQQLLTGKRRVELENKFS
jgi:type I restriction enzyme S subunit